VTTISVSDYAPMLIIEDLRTHRKVWLSTRHGSHPNQRRQRVRPGVIVMKFGEQLESSKIKDYEFFYLNYDKLKGLLKPSGPPITQPSQAEGSTVESSKKPTKSKGTERQWIEEDEDKFVRELHENLEKVYNKTQVVTTEIQRSIQVEERTVSQLVQLVENRGLGEEGPSEEDFIEHEDTLSGIIAEVHDLSKFVQINYIGFYKIVKKHDVSRLKACPTGPLMLRKH
jgi:SPX domain protein involved in polyphosphate accumulation